MAVDEEDSELTTRAHDGSRFILTKRRWLHIVDRHGELRTLLESIGFAAESPDEIFTDSRGMSHLVKRLHDAPSDFLILIARKETSTTYLVTAYLMGSKRKERRYRKFKKQTLS